MTTEVDDDEEIPDNWVLKLNTENVHLFENHSSGYTVRTSRVSCKTVRMMERRQREDNRFTYYMNVLVVVSHRYGEILLGPDCFKHINNSARRDTPPL
ncbi:unnamed protein product, partial [Coregonus sp. 'balchen']